MLSPYRQDYKLVQAGSELIWKRTDEDVEIYKTPRSSWQDKSTEAKMIEVTSFLIKHLYELMADDDQSDLDSLMIVMAQNQIPNLICDTIVELLFTFVSVALVIVIVALSEFYSDEVSCHFLVGFGCVHGRTIASPC